MPTFSADALREVAQNILHAVETPPDLAQIVSEALVLANLMGHDSHGVIRLNQYVTLVRRGQVQPDARAVVESQRAATAMVDAARGWGQPAARLATETVMQLANAQGLGAVTIRRCNHIGRLGEYVDTIARAGMIGMAVCNAEPAVAPYGGYKPMMGTNPIAWGIPRGDGQAPLVIDFATASVAEGKLRVARDKGESIPPGVVVDSAGRASEDPAAFYNGGALLPFGGHKGYGLSMLVEMLGGALSGNGTAGSPNYPGGNGTLLLAFDSGAFVSSELFLMEAEGLCARIKASPAAEGFDAVLLPGEPEAREYQRRTSDGIKLPDQTWSDIQALASELAVATSDQ